MSFLVFPGFASIFLASSFFLFHISRTRVLGPGLVWSLLRTRISVSHEIRVEHRWFPRRRFPDGNARVWGLDLIMPFLLITRYAKTLAKTPCHRATCGLGLSRRPQVLSPYVPQIWEHILTRPPHSRYFSNFDFVPSPGRFAF